MLSNQHLVFARSPFSSSPLYLLLQFLHTLLSPFQHLTPFQHLLPLTQFFRVLRHEIRIIRELLNRLLIHRRIIILHQLLQVIPIYNRGKFLFWHLRKSIVQIQVIIDIVQRLQHLFILRNWYTAR